MMIYYYELAQCHMVLVISSYKSLRAELVKLKFGTYNNFLQGCHETVATKFHDFPITVSQKSMTS